MEKYGFVYIWFDRKIKRYYVGAHWGYEDDGYICSSRWMLQAYRKRPETFRDRRILERIYTSKKDTFLAEARWLQLIKPEELGKKYYNLCRNASAYWTDEDKHLSANKKKSKTMKSNPALKTNEGNTWWTDGVNSICSKECPNGFYKGRTFEWDPRTGKSHSEKSKLIMSHRKKGKSTGPRSEETKLLLSEKAKYSQKGIRWWNNGITSLRSKESPGEEWQSGRIINWKCRGSTN